MPAGFWTLWTTVAIDLIGFGIVGYLMRKVDLLR